MSTFIAKLMTSKSAGGKLFSKIGPWLASPDVRREIGGYPVNDGPDYQWVVASGKRDLKAIGFLNFEHKPDRIILHHAYVIPERRDEGVFREMLRQCISYADHHRLPSQTTAQQDCAKTLSRRGFKRVGNKGSWIKLERKAK